MSKSRLILLGLLFVANLVQAEEPSRRLILPGSVFFEMPLARVDGAAAIWNQPANLGYSRGNEFLIMGTVREESLLKDWGFGSNFGFFGVATRLIRNEGDVSTREYALGVGVPIKTEGGLGFGYRFFPDGPDGIDNRHLWSVGFSWRSSRFLSFAAKLDNLNRGRIDGVRTQVEHRYSIAYRPESEWLTFSADVDLGSGERFGDARWKYEAEVRPKGGLAIQAAYRTDDTWTIGLRLNLLKEFFGGRAELDRKGKHQGTILYAGSTTKSRSSLFRTPRKSLIVRSASIGEADTKAPFRGTQNGFASKLLALSHAVDDQSIEKIYFVVEGGISFSQAYEFREQLARARQNGKQVSCYLSARGNVSYYLSSVADQIAIPPATALELVGLSAELTFYAETLRKLGLEADFIAFGRYKSAVEPFTLDSSSSHYRSQVNSLLDTLSAELLRSISNARGLPIDSLQQILDAGPYPSSIARDIGLIDTIMHRDQFLKEAERYGAITLGSYVEQLPVSDRWDSPSRIAVIVAEGEVVSDRSGSFGSSSPQLQPLSFKQQLDQAVGDPSVAGVVVRINSPGGLSSAGELIRFRASEGAKRKPLWISMSSLAASAGYDLATAGSRIYATPLTITGSIGIFGGKVSMSGLYDKIGFNSELYTRGENAAINSSARVFTDSERDAYRRFLKTSYDEFLSTVSMSRGLTLDSVSQLAEGRIFTGREAVTYGLVDQIGTLNDAVSDLADSLKLRQYEVSLLSRKTSLWASLRLPEIPGIFGKILSRVAGGSEIDEGSAIDAWTYARLPFDLSIR